MFLKNGLNFLSWLCGVFGTGAKSFQKPFRKLCLALFPLCFSLCAICYVFPLYLLCIFVDSLNAFVGFDFAIVVLMFHVKLFLCFCCVVAVSVPVVVSDVSRETSAYVCMCMHTINVIVSYVFSH